jgi:hypothetical protein
LFSSLLDFISSSSLCFDSEEDFSILSLSFFISSIILFDSCSEPEDNFSFFLLSFIFCISLFVQLDLDLFDFDEEELLLFFFT